MRNRLFSILVLFALIGCGGNDSNKQKRGSLRPAEGGRYYGGVFKFNEVEYFRSLYPLNVTEVGGHRVTNQIYEGLVRTSQSDLSILPALAERWEINEEATEFTFYLRKGVRFHDDPCFPDGKGREVTARDFQYSLTKLCESDVNNQGYWVFENRVKGCSEYFKSTQSGEPLPEGVTGVEVVDDYTLKIILDNPFASFLNILAMPFTAVFPKEAVEQYGTDLRAKCVGTGPFKIKALKEDETVILTRNKDYWDVDKFGNRLPYLDGIKISFIKDRKSELLELKKGNFDMMFRLPLEMLEEVVTPDDELTPEYSEFVLQVMPNMSIQYYGFQHWDKLFSNKDVRKAFNYAIDREKITTYTLKGSGIPAHYGIVPPALTSYDSKAVQGYRFNPEKAREHFAAAGYSNGEGFPELTLQINAGGGTNEQIAEAVQKMLQETLNIEVNITKLPFAQHLENLETGKANFWRAGWIADYPDAENFLNLFYSKHIPKTLAEKSYLNSTRFSSRKFDELFSKALQTIDDDERNLLYLKADQAMIDEAAIIPIYYYKDHRLLQSKVRNYPQNAMEYRTFREVYFVPESN